MTRRRNAETKCAYIQYANERGIESNAVRQVIYKFPGVAQLGSAFDWGSKGREFKSRHSDHYFKRPWNVEFQGLFPLPVTPVRLPIIGDVGLLN